MAEGEAPPDPAGQAAEASPRPGDEGWLPDCVTG